MFSIFGWRYSANTLKGSPKRGEISVANTLRNSGGGMLGVGKQPAGVFYPEPDKILVGSSTVMLFEYTDYMVSVISVS